MLTRDDYARLALAAQPVPRYDPCGLSVDRIPDALLDRIVSRLDALPVRRPRPIRRRAGQ